MPPDSDSGGFSFFMAKRFTDTEKWKDEWWGSLSNDYRMIWIYLVDSCSIAGIWKKDFRGLNFNCNTKITEKEFLEVFETRLIDRGNYFFIPKFLRFQCPKGLNSNKPAILSIIKELEQNNLILTVQQSLGNDFLIIKDKGKGTGQGKGEGKDTGTGTGTGTGIEHSNKTLDWFKNQIDSIFMESMKMNHKGKDIDQAIKDSYAHMAADPHRLARAEPSDCKKLLNTWLSNAKPNGSEPPKRKLAFEI